MKCANIFKERRAETQQNRKVEETENTGQKFSDDKHDIYHHLIKNGRTKNTFPKHSHACILSS